MIRGRFYRDFFSKRKSCKFLGLFRFSVELQLNFRFHSKSCSFNEAPNEESDEKPNEGPNEKPNEEIRLVGES